VGQGRVKWVRTSTSLEHVRQLRDWCTRHFNTAAAPSAVDEGKQAKSGAGTPERVVTNPQELHSV